MSDDTSDNKMTDVERALFRQAMVGIKKIAQDDRITPHHSTQISAPQKQQIRRKRQSATEDMKVARREQATHPFSSQFEPALPEGVMKYTANDANPYLSKQLRRGDFSPDLMVDLHGLTQAEAQRDLAAAVTECQRQQGFCLNVIHGVGSGVLRQRVPGWLMQHADVIAFHQAPLEWGGQGALLVLLKSTMLDWREDD